MPRTIIAVEPLIPNALSIRLIKATQNISNARAAHPFACTPDGMPPWGDPDAVKMHGQRLLEELEKHPAVKQALQFALMAPAGQTSPVYFHLNEEMAEQLSWEALYNEEKSFLGLDARWPIGRIADSVLDRPAPPQEFTPPLRMAAILSALDRQAATQWRALRDAVATARDDGLPVDLLVFVGEEPLLATIRDEIAAGLEGVTVTNVPDRTAELERELDAFAPHILHFFCHGTASHGVPRLEIATILDWLQGNSSGSIKLKVDDLQNIRALQDAWLVVLNCCEGGRAEENTHSMAHSLVANVVPAAIGTLEPFDVTDADELCLGFYPELFTEIRQALNGSADGWVELEWATALRGARRSLSEKHDDDPSNHREWALPVLYVRPEPWLIRVQPGLQAASGGDEDDAAVLDTEHADDAAVTAQPTAESVAVWKQKAEVVAGHLKALPPDTEPEVRNAILSSLANAPEWLKPDAFGNFDPTALNTIPMAHTTATAPAPAGQPE
jgi:hypothetical protein